MEPSGGGAPAIEVEAPKDPGALKTHTSFTDTEILGECIQGLSVFGPPRRCFFAPGRNVRVCVAAYTRCETPALIFSPKRPGHELRTWSKITSQAYI